MGEQYDIKVLFKYLVILVAIMAACKVSAGFAAIIVPIMVICAISRDKPVMLIFLMILSMFFAVSNRKLFANNAVTILTARVTLIIMTGLLATKLFSGGREARVVTPFWGVFAYVLWECAVSLQGWEPIISYLKLILFFAIFLGLLAAVNQVNRSTRTNAKILRSALLAMLCFLIFGSVLLIPFDVGMMARDDASLAAMKAGEFTSLFMGMTCHSQALGPMTAILGTFLLADLVFSIKRWDKLYVALLLCCPLLIIRSSSRTGMGTLIAGCGMVAFLALRARGLGAHWKGKLMSVMVILAVIGGVSGVAVPAVRERLAQYVLKYGKDTKGMTSEDIFASRQKKFDEMFAHIKQKPLQGHGFQVSEEFLYEKRHGFLEYLSAPVEKGTWIFAIVEEGGAIGMILFCGWLVFLIPALIKRHAYIGVCTFWAFLTANLGEFSIFAMSYIGGLFWSFVIAGLCLDVQRMKSQQLPVFFVPIEQVMAEVGMDEWVRRQG